jgi:hypothetical protein
MTFGITRVNGSLLSPKNFAGVGLADFTLTFWVGDSVAAWRDNNAGDSTPNGPLEQVFRTAVGTVGSISRVGTYNSGTQALRFAIEVLGVDAESPGFLGTGPTNASPATTAAALEDAVQALGTVSFTAVNSTLTYSVALSSATVVAFTY